MPVDVFLPLREEGPPVLVRGGTRAVSRDAGGDVRAVGRADEGEEAQYVAGEESGDERAERRVGSSDTLKVGI